jgi:hypothetical protein
MQIMIRRGTPNDAAAMAQQMSAPDMFTGLLQMPYPNETIWQHRLESNRPELALAIRCA